MMMEIPLRPLPNPRVQVRLNGDKYVITIHSRNGGLYATVAINDVIIARNRVLRSFAPIEGNLMIVDTEGTSDPDWKELGQRYKLFWWAKDE